MVRFLVTTKADRVEAVRPEGARVYMVDGTVPSWVPKDGDGHWDHHKLGGADIQLDEMMGFLPSVSSDDLIVTTQVDADACVAAAWLMLHSISTQELPSLFGKGDIAYKLAAVAHDCDHLHVPKSASYGHLADFAAKAVADLKQQGFKLAGEMGLPKDKRQWTPEQQEDYASRCFRDGTMWLVEAALGKRPWPGDSPDADKYWAKVEAHTQMLINENRIWLSQSGGSVIYSTKGVNEYVDPRSVLRAIAKLGLEPSTPIVLAIRDYQDRSGSGQVGDSFTPGSNPMHPRHEVLDYSRGGAWLALNHAELEARQRDLPQSIDPFEVDNHWDGERQCARPTFESAVGFSAWGGRGPVGGSPWNSPSALAAEHVAKILEATWSAA